MTYITSNFSYNFYLINFLWEACETKIIDLIKSESVGVRIETDCRLTFCTSNRVSVWDCAPKWFCFKVRNLVLEWLLSNGILLIYKCRWIDAVWFIAWVFNSNSKSFVAYGKIVRVILKVELVADMIDTLLAWIPWFPDGEIVLFIRIIFLKQNFVVDRIILSVIVDEELNN